MLVLTRRVGEVVVIGNDVVVTVLSVSGRQVRIGIKAPSTVPILRQELYERVRNEERVGQTSTRDNTKGIEPGDRSSLAQRPAQL